jgi:hypothetical protein
VKPPVNCETNNGIYYLLKEREVDAPPKWANNLIKNESLFWPADILECCCKSNYTCADYV